MSENMVCQVCGDALSTGTAVHCVTCGTPHHKDCWEWVKRCSTYGCTSRTFSTKPLMDSGASEVLVIDETTADAPPPHYVAAFRQPIARLDKLFDLELAVGCSSGLFFFLFVFFSGSWAWACLPVSLVLLVVHACLVDQTYLLENETKQLIYYEQIFGHVRRRIICSFADIRKVEIVTRTTQNKGRAFHHYKLRLHVHGRSKPLEVSDETQIRDQAYGRGRALAAHLHVPIFDAGPLVLENSERDPSLQPLDITPSRLLGEALEAAKPKKEIAPERKGNERRRRKRVRDKPENRP